MSKKTAREHRSGRVVGNIHDQAFKRFFDDGRKISGLLKKLIPSDIFDRFDWRTLTKVDSTVFSRHNLRERHGDIIASVKLKGGGAVAIYLVLEHKAQKGDEALLQIMDCCACLARSNPKSRILPVIVVCCEDEQYEIPNNYNDLMLKMDNLTQAEEDFLRSPLLPSLFSCWVFNLRKLPSDVFWTDEETRDIDFLISGLTSYWKIHRDNEELVLGILARLREFTQAEQAVLFPLLMDYYESGDKIGRGDFDRIDRKRNPDLPEEDRPMTLLEFSYDKAIKQGRTQGIEEGIEKGIEKGIVQDVKQNREETALRLLGMGVDHDVILRATGFKKSELLALMQELKN